MGCLRLGLQGVVIATLSFVPLFASSAQGMPSRKEFLAAPETSAGRVPEAACNMSTASSEGQLFVPRSLLHPPGCLTLPADFPASPACSSKAANATHCGDVPVGEPSQQSLGRRAGPILGARSRTLAILEAGGACSQWFRLATSDPGSTFRTLSFAVDSRSADYVTELKDGANPGLFVSPYVAAVMQDGGEFQVGTLNAGGAFFRTSARLVDMPREGRPIRVVGSRTLKVGPYIGNTLQAQVTTLLHELGHVLGLLPLDANDVNSQSAANTRDVLRHCQPEIEASGKHFSLAASR